jgi:hypothetical protein
VARYATGTTAKEITDALQRPKATAHLVLNSLVADEYLARTSDLRGFALCHVISGLITAAANLRTVPNCSAYINGSIPHRRAPNRRCPADTPKRTPFRRPDLPLGPQRASWKGIGTGRSQDLRPQEDVAWAKRTQSRVKGCTEAPSCGQLIVTPVLAARRLCVSTCEDEGPRMCRPLILTTAAP